MSATAAAANAPGAGKKAVSDLIGALFERYLFGWGLGFDLGSRWRRVRSFWLCSNKFPVSPLASRLSQKVHVKVRIFVESSVLFLHPYGVSLVSVAKLLCKPVNPFVMSCCGDRDPQYPLLTCAISPFRVCRVYRAKICVESYMRIFRRFGVFPISTSEIGLQMMRLVIDNHFQKCGCPLKS